MPSKFPPEPPPCPLCGNQHVEFQREYDNYEEHFRGQDGQPASTSYFFACQCGCSFAVTIPKHTDERMQEYSE